jgi:hypothetical protein
MNAPNQPRPSLTRRLPNHKILSVCDALCGTRCAARFEQKIPGFQFKLQKNALLAELLQ